MFHTMCICTVGFVEDYQPPYYEKLYQDPPFEEVKKVVCEEKYRPVVLKTWYNDEVSLSLLFSLVKKYFPNLFICCVKLEITWITRKDIYQIR